MKSLIIGGTSGLGAALADSFVCRGDETYVTGRHNPSAHGQHYIPLRIEGDVSTLDAQVKNTLSEVGTVDRLVYSVGVSQVGELDDFSFDELVTMFNASLLGCVEFVRQILQGRGALTELVVISSTSAHIPRGKESAYAAAKSGLSHFVRSIAEDERIQKTLLVSPAGMNTKMQLERNRSDIDELLDPGWVAEKIIDELMTVNNFCEILVLREPPRIEVVTK